MLRTADSVGISLLPAQAVANGQGGRGCQVMRELAVARGVALKEHLASRSLSESRMFLGAPQLKKQADAWPPQVELKLVSG